MSLSVFLSDPISPSPAFVHVANLSCVRGVQSGQLIIKNELETHSIETTLKTRLKSALRPTLLWAPRSDTRFL